MHRNENEFFFLSRLRNVVSPWMFVSFVWSGSSKRKNTCTDMERDVLRLCRRFSRLDRAATRPPPSEETRTSHWRNTFYGFNVCVDSLTEAWAWIAPVLREIMSTLPISSTRGTTTRGTFCVSTTFLYHQCLLNEKKTKSESHRTNWEFGRNLRFQPPHQCPRPINKQMYWWV